jgi:hypothetical protein
MCVPSVVADDWITKGCHIHVDGIELALRPDHQGDVVFSSVFSYPAEAAVEAAKRRAREECLANRDQRKRWLESVQRAMVHLVSHRGALRELAIGRLAELHFLEIALTRYGDKDGR